MNTNTGPFIELIYARIVICRLQFTFRSYQQGQADPRRANPCCSA